MSDLNAVLQFIEDLGGAIVNFHQANENKTTLPLPFRPLESVKYRTISARQP